MLFQSFSLRPPENTYILASRGPIDKVKSSQVNPKVILVQLGGGGGGGAIRSLVVELLARARKGHACVHTRNGANSLGGMSQD